MKNILFFLLLLTITINAHAQKGFPKYYEYVTLAQKGDSLYQAKDYKNAGLAYLAAGKIQVEKGIEVSEIDMYYNAACSLSLSPKANEAFNCLNFIVAKNYSDYDKIASDSDFLSIHKDKRWQQIISQVKINKNNKDRKELLIKQRTTISPENRDILFYPYTDYAKTFLENDTLCFLSANYENFRLFFTGNSYALQHINDLKPELSVAFNRALSILNVKSYNRGINILLVDSPEELKELTGIWARGGVASIGNDLAFFPYNKQRRIQFKHEIFHLISNNVWGITQSRLLNEGSAVYADNECYYDNPLYAIASYLLQSKKTFPLKSLIEEFDNKARESDVIAYLQSAAVFKYLYEKYGIEKMKLLWITGFENFKSIYGLTIEDFEKEWTNYINTIPAPKDMDEKKLLTQGCG